MHVTYNNSSAFHSVSVVPLDPLTGGKKPENLFNFQRYFRREDNILECLYCSFHINRFTSAPQKGKSFFWHNERFSL